jgi:serine/threonine protein kinase
MSDSTLSDTTTTAKSKSGSMGSTVTVAVAVLFCLVIVGIAIFVVRRRKPKEEEDEDLNSPSTTSAHFNGTAAVAAVDNAASNYNHVPSTKNDLAVVPPRQSSTTTTSSSALVEDPEILAVRLPVEKIESHELLSRGGYGEVHRGTYNGQQVAIKRLLPERRQDARQIDGFLAEAKMMSTLKHEHIVQFIGVAWTSLSDLCVVSEFMEGGDLRAVLQRWRQDPSRGNGFDHDRIKIAVDVANAMSYLHSREPGILHRDLKSKNILLTPTLDAKLTDFGVSRERVDATMTAGVGTSLWMAPEVIMGGRYDEKADVFSFGAVLSELDTLRLPYANVKEPGTGRKLPDSVILQMVALGKIEVEFTANADAEMVALGRDCMAMDPKARPTAGEAYHRMYQLAQNRVSL